jgi:hypothetical protein
MVKVVFVIQGIACLTFGINFAGNDARFEQPLADRRFLPFGALRRCGVVNPASIFGIA